MNISSTNYLRRNIFSVPADLIGSIYRHGDKLPLARATQTRLRDEVISRIHALRFSEIILRYMGYGESERTPFWQEVFHLFEKIQKSFEYFYQLETLSPNEQS